MVTGLQLWLQVTLEAVQMAGVRSADMYGLFIPFFFVEGLICDASGAN